MDASGSPDVTRPAAVDSHFWSKVLKGPEWDDHWLWTGAVADDGYGRYFLKIGDKETSVRPQRYAWEETTGTPLGAGIVLRHQCNIPIRARPTQLLPGTQRQNMLDRAWDGRHAHGATWRWRGIPRALFAERSRALRDASLEHGWNPAIPGPLISGADPEAPTLF